MEVKGNKGKKIDYTIEEAVENMKLMPWRALRGIKDERLVVSVLSRVISKEHSLDDTALELSKCNNYIWDLVLLCLVTSYKANTILCEDSSRDDDEARLLNLGKSRGAIPNYLFL